jgi:glycosyltransferase involved in cell wall biosynthesis
MYGNVVALLRNCITMDGVHLDIGCGYGAIAEVVRDELGLSYIGFDLAVDGLDSLRQRGFNVHQVDLSDPGESEAKILAATGGRPIASLTFLDTLEHITNGPATLAMLRRLAERSAAPLVLSVPNITHKDIALKLLTAHWDVTEAGLLDHTHVECYSYRRLTQLMTVSGWREIEARDWLLEYSDQHFPPEAPTLDITLPVGQFLRRLVDQANPHALVNQFVRSYSVDQPKSLSLWHDRAEPARPLFSVLVATRRESACSLTQISDSLAKQTNQDFELVFLFHPRHDDVAEMAAVVGELPDALRMKTVTVASSHSRLASALNAALERIAGRYLVILQAEDVAEPHWLSTFAELSKRTPNSVLRIGIFKDGTGKDSSGSAIYPFALEAFEPVASFAVPGGAFRELGIRFAEDMDYLAEVDFIAQAVMLCGMTASNVAAVSRRSTAEEVVVAEKRAAMTAAHAQIVNKLNRHPLILPLGSAVELQRQAAETEANRRYRAFPMLRTLYDRYIASPAKLTTQHPDPPKDKGPFLSIITRTMGNRLATLRDTLMTLAGQSSQDFELQLVVHASAEATMSAVRSLVEEFPPPFRTRINIIQCNRPGRSAPLNDAIDHARGRYIAVLDDDDFVFAHWVETFERLSRERPGAMLRATCAAQVFDPAYKGNALDPHALSWFQMRWPSAYDAIDHLHGNYSPFMSLAFPSSVFKTLKFRWDESLSTNEDWQLGIHIAMICGIADTPEVTAVYRWWKDGESSTFLHSSAEWQSNRESIIAKLNTQPILLPEGSVAKICSLIDNNLDMRSKALHLAASNEQLTTELATLRSQVATWESLKLCAAVERDQLQQERDQLQQERDQLQQERDQLQQERDQLQQERDQLQQERDLVLSSTSWRMMAPARWAMGLMPCGLRFYVRRVVKLLYWLITPYRMRQRIAFLKARRAAAGRRP